MAAQKLGNSTKFPALIILKKMILSFQLKIRILFSNFKEFQFVVRVLTYYANGYLFTSPEDNSQLAYCVAVVLNYS